MNYQIFTSFDFVLTLLSVSSFLALLLPPFSVPFYSWYHMHVEPKLYLFPAAGCLT